MSRIREVWAPNLELEMNNIRDLIEKYPYVALVRFPRRLLADAAMFTPSLFSLGHRVSRGCRPANRRVQDIFGLPLPNDAM